MQSLAADRHSNTRVSRIITKDELCLLEKKSRSCGIVIFGASGDLAHRKLFPALLTLLRDNVLPADYFVLGVSRTPLSDEAFRAGIRQAVRAPALAARLDDFLSRCYYLSGDYDAPATYDALAKKLDGLNRAHRIGPRTLFYLSTPPELYGPIATRLGESGLARLSERGEESWSRLVVEKPFGVDFQSADALNHRLHRHFRESQIYRIDHYLGKETVQNILMFRFANAIYEPVWNYRYIDHVQITAAETAGIEHRAGYYEKAGALRDMFQNHLFQLLSLVAMEPPSSFEAEALRDEKAKVMASLSDQQCDRHPERAVRAQYEGYRQEKDVTPRSATETFVALRVEIENWRWQGVPFYLRSGKRLKDRVTEIVIQFKNVPSSIFKPLMADQMSPNILRFRIQPDEGISLQFEAKHPGPKLCMSTVTMNFDYKDAFGVEPPEAYARLFQDVMLGDPSLFARQDWVRNSWRYLDPILANWNAQKEKGLCFYNPGGWGPEAADQLLIKEGRQWLTS